MAVRRYLLTLVGVGAAVVAGCSSEAPAGPDASSSRLPSGEVPAAADDFPLSAAQAPSSSYDSELTMGLFSGFTMPSERALGALKSIEEQHDTSQVPVLIEVIRFQPSQGTRDAFAKTLRALTGESFGGNDWPEWMEWHGKNRADFRPPPQYAAWKARLLSLIDRRFALFLRTAEETSRIDLTEVVWGGVIPDGIPDLRNPPVIPANYAAYLGLDERVFGVSINGESRAYPLRITNPHEMVNDVLGGEPISLLW